MEKRKECVLFGKRVRAFREKIGISQEAFAELASVHRTYLGGLERGERNPTLTTIIRVSKALDVEPAELIK